MKISNARHLWSRLLVLAGGLGMVFGAVDPMEGSVVILPGSLLMAIGTLLGGGERRLVRFRVMIFVLIALGVVAMWGLSAVGGIGGSSGHSVWWGVLILPYLAGWSLGVSGPGSPRWLVLAGMAVGLWYLILLTMVLRGHHHSAHPMSVWPVVIVATTGVLTIAGGIRRLSKSSPPGPA